MKLIWYAAIAAVIGAFAFGILKFNKTKEGMSIDYNQKRMEQTLDKAKEKFDEFKEEVDEQNTQ